MEGTLLRCWEEHMSSPLQGSENHLCSLSVPCHVYLLAHTVLSSCRGSNQSYICAVKTLVNLPGAWMTGIFHKSFSSSVKPGTIFQKHHRSNEFPSYKSLCREPDLPISASFLYPSFLSVPHRFNLEEPHEAYGSRLVLGEKLTTCFCLGTILQGHPWDIGGGWEKVDSAGRGSALPFAS